MEISEALRQVFSIAEKYVYNETLAVGQPPYTEPEVLFDQLSLQLDGLGVSEAEFWQSLENIALATTRTASPTFLNQLYGGRNLPALAGELLTPLLNTSLYTYKVGGPHVLIEKEVVRFMGELAGFNDATADGVFTPGGSMSNLIAMLAARNQIYPKVRENGFDGRAYTLYTSEESHYSIPKNASILGIGRNNVRRIATDERGRMDVKALETAIVQDQAAGCVPFLVIGTAGTTVLGAFDPLEALADVAQRHGLWFHVDGAFGGSALLSDRRRYLLKGVDRADSFVWNPHKMMNVPLSASVVLVKERAALYKNLSQAADYLFQGEREEYDPGHKSIQCGRRNDALKVWCAFRFFGIKGLAERIERQFELAQYAANRIKQDPALTLVEEPQLINVCFDVNGCAAPYVCEKLDETGAAKVSYGVSKGRTFIRVVFINPDLTFQDVDRFFEKVKEAARQPVVV